MRLGMSPADYWQLTVAQRAAILTEARKRNPNGS